MALNLVFLFRVENNGDQVPVVIEAFDHTLSAEQLMAWTTLHSAKLCGEFQVDAVSEASVRAVFTESQGDYAGSQWSLWTSQVQGVVSPPQLSGVYYAEHLSLTGTCSTASPPPIQTTEQVPVMALVSLETPTPTPMQQPTLAPAPIITVETQTATPVAAVTSKQLAATGANSTQVLLLLVLILVLAGLACTRGAKKLLA